jgi:glyoxylase-like metal-dependent hydrolase (beta-lactamase superfamily II)
MGVHEITKLSGAKVYALAEEAGLCGDADLNASAQIRRPYTIEVDEKLSDGQEISIEGMGFKVYATPGHTVGSCCYYIESRKWLFSGDTLFCGSIGRSDLPTGDGKKIMESVHMLINTFDGDVKVYPGHGDSSTIGAEKAYNPFCS